MGVPDSFWRHLYISTKKEWVSLNRKTTWYRMQYKFSQQEQQCSIVSVHLPSIMILNLADPTSKVRLISRWYQVGGGGWTMRIWTCIVSSEVINTWESSTAVWKPPWLIRKTRSSYRSLCPVAAHITFRFTRLWMLQIWDLVFEKTLWYWGSEDRWQPQMMYFPTKEPQNLPIHRVVLDVCLVYLGSTSHLGVRFSHIRIS